MYTYRVISDVTDVPEMTDLEAAFIEEPSGGDAGLIAFTTGYILNPVPYERAVGATCRTVRTSDDGESQECAGAVDTVTPVVRVALNGAGWQ